MGIGSFYIPLAVYIIGIIMALLTIFVRAELGLIYLILFLPLQNIKQKMHVFPLGEHFYDILVLALIVACVLKRKDGTSKIVDKTPSNITMFMYVGSTFIGLLLGSSYLGLDFLSADNYNRISDWKNLMLLPILYWVSLNSVKDKKWMKLIVLSGMISILFTDLFFYREFRWYKSFYYTHDMRVSGAFAYLGPNELGAFFAQYGIFILTLLLFATGFRGRLLLGGLFASTFYCLMYSFSRAGYLAFPIGSAFVLFFKSKRLLVVFLILLIISPKLLPVSVMQRIEMTTLSQDEKIEAKSSERGGKGADNEPMFDSSAQGRLDIWEYALEMFKSSPIFGVGFRTFGYVKNIDTHNNFVKILAELGLIGFCIYLVLYFIAFKSGWQLYRKAEDKWLKGLGLGFAGCVVGNMIVNLTHDNWSYLNLMGIYWIFWGLVVRSKMWIEKTSENDV